jgi:pimeloyl-ACP methyl ester carboxylesterase
MSTAAEIPRLNYVQCLGSRGLHRMAWWEWGDPANPRVLVCAHGLTRQGRDFDVLAQSLSAHYRVVCPDVVGRGQSDWLSDPAGYQVLAYVADMVTLLARLDAAEVHWVGTSMGGLIGMTLAALPNSPIRRLVLNDVGPCLRYEAIARIGSYVGNPVRWNNLDEAIDYMQLNYAAFGPHSREQWAALTKPMLKTDGDGFIFHYDPRIGAAFRSLTPEVAAAGEAVLWRSYEAIRCPVLLLRGGDSDLLTREAAVAMTQRGPKARLVEFAGVGHAPTMIAPDQVKAVGEFLR